jgi:iron(III) transport system ATP-binding protein
VESGTAFITVKNLIKRFGELAAVNDVSFDVAENHTMALLGPSGCGKTTILRCLGGLETPDQGYIEIGGNVVFDSARGINLMPEARQLGIVFQSYAVWPHMTVMDNVGFPLKVRGASKAQQRERVEKILDLVGLGQWIDRPATQLSGGQQQRVALARALVHEPRLVLFDEPMSNLDAQLREHVRMELKVLQERLGFTAIYVTHDQSEAFALAEKIIVMNRGKIDTVGQPKDVFHRPETPFVARFLGLNVLEATVASLGGDAASAAPPSSGGGQVAQIALDGSSVKLWGEVGGGATVRAGDRVLACIRKEHLNIRGASAPSLPGAQLVPGEIRASSFLGLVDEYIVEVGGIEMRALQPFSGATNGDKVQVEIQPAHCIVLSDPDAAAAVAARAA